MFSADGKFLVSGSGDKTVKLWDLKDGRLVHTIKGHLNEVRGVAFQRGGKRVASASSDGTVKLWDPVVGQDPLDRISYRSDPQPGVPPRRHDTGHFVGRSQRPALGSQDRPAALHP